MREYHLDGLRGWAALVVAINHAGTFFFGLDPVFFGWRLPIYDGTFAVFVFFVLSGYVLSAEFFRTGDRKVILALALRRYPRLTIPIAASVILAMLLIIPGSIYTAEAGKINQHPLYAQMFQGTPTLEAAAWFSVIGVYLTSSGLAFNPVFWTMHYEMFGSVLLFGFLLLAGKSALIRAAGHATFIGVTWALKSPILAMAFGVLLADFVHSPVAAAYCRQRGASALSLTLLLASLWIAGSRARWQDFGPLPLCSAGVLFAVLTVPALRRSFSSPLSMLLGRYSFPLYVTHFLVLGSFTSFVFVRAVEQGADTLPVRCAIVLVSLALFALVARLFKPVDDFAISVSRRFARAVLGLFDPRRPGAREAALTHPSPL